MATGEQDQKAIAFVLYPELTVLDMTLYLAARLKSEQQAKTIQTAMEYDPDPPFGGLEQNGGAGGNRLAIGLAENRADLERALADRPDLHQKLFG